MLACAPGGLGGDADANEAVGCHADSGILADPMREENTELGVEEAERVDDGGRNEIVPVKTLVKTNVKGAWDRLTKTSRCLRSVGRRTPRIPTQQRNG